MQSDNEIWSVNGILYEKHFLEKSCTKSGGETIRRPFSKNSELNISLVNSLKFYTVCFYCMPS